MLFVESIGKIRKVAFLLGYTPFESSRYLRASGRIVQSTKPLVWGVNRLSKYFIVHEVESRSEFRGYSSDLPEPRVSPFNTRRLETKKTSPTASTIVLHKENLPRLKYDTCTAYKSLVAWRKSSLSNPIAGRFLELHDKNTHKSTMSLSNQRDTRE